MEDGVILFLSLVGYGMCTSPLPGSTARQRLPFSLLAGHFGPGAGQWFWSVPESKKKAIPESCCHFPGTLRMQANLGFLFDLNLYFPREK